MTAENLVPALELRDVVKTYGTVQALRGANLTVYPNEVVALIGDNGAGKSTIIKTLSGIIQPDSGSVYVDGEPVVLGNAIAARSYGIETVYQDLALAPDLDPSANLFLGREMMRTGVLGKLGFLDKRAMQKQAQEAFSRLGVGLQDTSHSVETMSGGQRQGIAVARAVVWASKVVLMDEPTAALGVTQTERVKDLIESVRASGVSVVLISHNLPFVFAVADRVEVLRLGQRVATFTRAELTAEKVLGAMTGALEFSTSASAGPHVSPDVSPDGGPDVSPDGSPDVSATAGATHA